MSAGTLSPEARSTRSPGTSSEDGSFCMSPLRRTMASVVTDEANALIADSAFDSWAKAITAFRTATPVITPASIQEPMKALTTPAISRI